MRTERARKRNAFLRFSNPLALFASRRWARASLPTALSSIPDPLAESIVNGTVAGYQRRNPDRDLRTAVRAIRDQARATGTQEEALAKLTHLVFEYPGFEPFQKLTARFLHEARDERALGAWLGICLRFPASMDAFHNLVLLVHRHKGRGMAVKLIRARFPNVPKRLDELLAYAEACDVAGITADRRAAFERLARMFRNRRDSWLLASSWLEEEVGIHRAAVTLLRRLAAGTGLGPPMVDRGRLASVVTDIERIDGAQSGANSAASVRVLGTLFDRIIQERLARAPQPQARGGVLLLTGSLGAGGAERQLVNTAVGLSDMSLRQRTLMDGTVLDPIKVVARSLRDRKDGAFYLADLQKAGVEVQAYRDLPDFSGNLAASAVRPALGALGFLPWSTAEAVIKLTDWLKAANPEVVHIWQDGLVYAAGLAALLAGVPRIVLSGRSTPPPDRRERYLIEYDIIYRSLLKAPGVMLSVNSSYSASRYAAWLDIDLERIAVIMNGVAPPSRAADLAAELAFGEFDRRTSPGGLTVGAVMRLDEVKRPLLWMDTAAHLLALRPTARFIIVGDGPFRIKMERRAEVLGIADRCLFAGRSDCVGYWLAKMDMLMLLSEHEGLPNALIEAQLSGVPVVASAAGGAPETLVPEKTGIVVPADGTPGQVAQLVVKLAAEPGRLPKMGAAAQEWAKEAFPLSRMLTNTLALYSAAGQITAISAKARLSPAGVGEARLRYIGL